MAYSISINNVPAIYQPSLERTYLQPFKQIDAIKTIGSPVHEISKLHQACFASHPIPIWANQTSETKSTQGLTVVPMQIGYGIQRLAAIYKGCKS